VTDGGERAGGDETPPSDSTGTAGTATVAIGGACSGCGIAPMTMNAIEQPLPESVDRLDDGESVRSGGPRAAVMPSKTDDVEEMDECEDDSPPFWAVLEGDTSFDRDRPAARPM